MKLRRSSALLFTLVLIGVSSTSCDRGGSGGEGQNKKSSPELDAAQQQLAAAEKRLTVQQEQIAAAASAAAAAQKQAADSAAAVLEKDGQLRALQKEVTELRKGEAQSYADASATFMKGVTSTTLNRYQQFARDFPKSPLAVDANRAIAELTVTVEREAQWRQGIIDPKRPEREALKHFADGVASLDEIVPLVRKKTKPEVIAVLGPPGTTYRGGLEIGYVSRVIDPKTGERGTLIITFQEGKVVSLRVGYQGQELRL
jgi:multidrug efflux pump subunit AcrA (membrane-fusion protein)